MHKMLTTNFQTKWTIEFVFRWTTNIFETRLVIHFRWISLISSSLSRNSFRTSRHRLDSIAAILMIRFHSVKILQLFIQSHDDITVLLFVIINSRHIDDQPCWLRWVIDLLSISLNHFFSVQKSIFNINTYELNVNLVSFDGFFSIIQRTTNVNSSRWRQQWHRFRGFTTSRWLIFEQRERLVVSLDGQGITLALVSDSSSLNISQSLLLCSEI